MVLDGTLDMPTEAIIRGCGWFELPARRFGLSYPFEIWGALECLLIDLTGDFLWPDNCQRKILMLAALDGLLVMQHSFGVVIRRLHCLVF